MRRFLRAPYTYAKDAVDYPAGVLPWSGQPKIVQPSDSVLNVGATPDTPIPAETVNYLESIKADAITIQNHAALTHWDHYTLPGSASLGKFIVPVPAIHGAGSSNNTRPRMFVVVGVNGTPHAIATPSIDGRSYEQAVVDAGFGAFACIGTDDAGLIFGGLSGATTCEYSTDRGVTWTTFTPGLTQQLESVYYTGTNHVVAGGGQVANSTSLTGGWSSVGTYGSTGDHAYQIVGNRINGSTATVLAMYYYPAGGSPTSRILYSTDGGVTWTLGHDFGASVTLRLTFSEAWGLFVVVTSAGALWVSADCVSWTQIKTASALIDGQFQNGIACVGQAIALIVNHYTGGGTTIDNTIGIAYTFDLGATWNETYFGDTSDNQSALSGLQFLVAANGRLYACDDRRVYISGALESPPDLYLGV